MEIETILTTIGSYGFPIVACIFMWKFINTTLGEFTKTLTENTIVLEKLKNTIDKSIDE